MATLKPTYKLLIGTPGKSNAFAISERLGLPGEIVRRAEQLVGEENKRFEQVLTDLEGKRQEMERERERAERLRIQTAKELAEAEAEREKFSAARDREVQKARNDAQRMLEELEQLQKEKDAKDFKERLKSARKQLTKQIETAEDAFAIRDENPETPYTLPRPLEVGDYVYIRDINKNGTVVTLPDGKGNLQVQAGLLKLRVNVGGLRLEKRPDPNAQLKKEYRASMPKRTGEPVKRELDLRGMTGDEACLEIDNFLDRAMLTGVTEVTIIHGKGTGALRAAVRDHLRNHAHVKSARRGAYGEGEDGVTVVEVK